MLIFTSNASPGMLCDDQISIPKDHPFAYKNRGDRCEGIYIKKISGYGGSIVSFLKIGKKVKSKNNNNVYLYWDIPKEPSIFKDKIVYIEAKSINQRIPYRMDTQISSNNYYEWKTDIIEYYKLDFTEICIKAIMRNNDEKKIKKIIIPLELCDDSKVRNFKDKYEIKILSDKTISKALLSIVKTNSNGELLNVAYNNLKVISSEKPYRALYPINFRLNTNSGFYFFNIGLEYESGDFDSIDGYFYHSQ
jgi:hypothetical protein